jgi:uncharacterized protein (DUF58 family)
MFRRQKKPHPLSAATAVHKKPSRDFSLTGLIYCSMMMFMGLAASQSQANLLFGVFGLMIGTLLVTGVISRMVLRRLELHRVLPELAVVGQTTSVTYEFKNAKRYWPSLSVTLAELEGTEAFTHQLHSYMLHAAAGSTAVVATEATPKRRGLHQLDHYQISTSFPFGFIKRAVVHRQKDTMLVYPALAKVDQRVLSLCRSADSSGATMRPRSGGMDEFYGVKEFRHGNNPRFIYWRRSARTGVLVAKEMTQVAPPRLMLLVDTYLGQRTLEAHGDVERSIAMAASLANQALEAGLSVGLLARSEERWLTVTPGRGKRHRRDLLAHLAMLPLNKTSATVDLLTQSREVIESGTTPVLLTHHDVQVALSDHLRSGLLVLSSNSPQTRRWFQFAPTVDFLRSMPMEQDPRMKA